jgi:diguanylate cyclase (GGDEF)-like protein
LGSFKKRLLTLIVTVVALSEGVTAMLAYVSLSKSVGQQAERALDQARPILKQTLASRSMQLRTATDAIVADFAFREAFASGDIPTITSALRNHASRVKADVGLIYGLDGEFITSNIPEVTAARLPPIPEDDQINENTFAVINGRAYELVFVQLRAPRPLAWVALGVALDKNMASELNGTINAEVSILAGDGNASTVASTLPESQISKLAAGLQTGDFARPAVARVDGIDYLTLREILPAKTGRIELLLQRRMDLALGQVRAMWLALLLICGLTLLAAIGVAVFAGNSAVKPLARLVGVARQIARGNYKQHIEIKGDEEFQQLGKTLNLMQAAIEQREIRIFEQATQDSLTGFANRTAFHQMLGLRTQSSQTQPLTVALIDLHGFRDINASVGYRMGDELLRVLADRLRVLMGAAQQCARIGADQFAMAWSTGDAEVCRMLSALATEWHHGVVVENLKLTVDVRIGVAEWRQSVSPDDMLRQAGVALAEAKSRGVTLVSYVPGLDAELNRRVTLVAELRRAIASDGLSLAYQPLVATSNRETLLFEALVRWTHPTLGDISPGEFVPLAERALVIGDLSRWVMAAAIRQLGVWRQIGLQVPVAINLSASDLADPELPLRLLTLLQEHQVLPSQVMLEVTESAVMHDARHAAQMMERLRIAGIRFAIDDFGTGYSSLAALHSLPVDELKLDRAFITNLDSNQNNQAIVRATIELAHRMGLKVVAEGVETPQVWDVLARLGCDIVQGYFISRPMKVDAVPGWLASQRAQPKSEESFDQPNQRVTVLRPRGGDKAG